MQNDTGDRDPSMMGALFEPKVAGHGTSAQSVVRSALRGWHHDFGQRLPVLPG
jgi:hypothetical protein